MNIAMQARQRGDARSASRGKRRVSAPSLAPIRGALLLAATRPRGGAPAFRSGRYVLGRLVHEPTDLVCGAMWRVSAGAVELEREPGLGGGGAG